jgi:hypothetical protein
MTCKTKQNQEPASTHFTFNGLELDMRQETKVQSGAQNGFKVGAFKNPHHQP